MYDTTELDGAVDRLADRLRAAPQSRLGRGAAAEGLALARELAARAQRLEGAAEVRVMPDAGVFAVGDQLAVAGADLAEALRTAAHRDGASGAVTAAELAEAVAAVRAAAARAAL
ncbi:hypothetical protein M4914_08735 [Streptomyces somaliensis DSM 40738]|uniref:Uncharacterized protein n=1 Tax=Streptomyces somaliensis (strain ATCC 33201 / DSM 40738 / JCM 12659 / KCTC 9044 / NCTC 11332 / NRRL B-12077 / IP 733) TaxID=1134445 RepID=A0AA44DBZ7_STRE0|nr:hypothetical protein [Streptomyces somaliensis]MCQ0023023.1 hypothetical protein [Streptomyces somaliensis DSM 40738]NKY13937.1 hypothetical protein [Streptomyces somaliensis DSM 40738]